MKERFEIRIVPSLSTHCVENDPYDEDNTGYRTRLGRARILALMRWQMGCYNLLHQSNIMDLEHRNSLRFQLFSYIYPQCFSYINEYCCYDHNRLESLHLKIVNTVYSWLFFCFAKQ